MTRAYFSEQECLAGLREALGADAPGARGALAEEVAHALLRDMAAMPERSEPHAFEVKVGTWAIRDDELDAIALIKDAVLLHLAMSAGSATGGPWVAVGVTVARLLLALHRKGVRLTQEQALVLTELRRLGNPRPVADLAEALGADWDEPKVASQLASLAAATSRSGVIKLAERLPDGRWIAHG